jgi:hypothetical protein
MVFYEDAKRAEATSDKHEKAHAQQHTSKKEQLDCVKP